MDKTNNLNISPNNQSKARIKKSNSLKSHIQKIRNEMAPDKTVLNETLNKALRDCIEHSLLTGANEIVNNFLIEIRSGHQRDGKAQPGLSHMTINKIKMYIVNFVEHLELNDNPETKSQRPLYVKKGTKSGLQMEPEKLERYLNSLPRFEKWTQPRKPKSATPSIPSKPLREQLFELYNEIDESQLSKDELRLYKQFTIFLKYLPE